MPQNLFSQVRKDIRSALLSFLSFAVIFLVTVESNSIFNRSDSVNRLVLEQVESIARARVISPDYLALQQELTHFVDSFRSTLPYSIKVKVLLDDKQIAGGGEIPDRIVPPLTLNRVSQLPSGQRMTVSAEVGLKNIYIEALTILAAILFACIALYKYLLWKLEKSLELDSSPIQQRLDRAAIDEEKIRISEQVAHDIRSPLTTAAMVIREAKLNEPDRASLENAISRINDVLNDLRSGGVDSPASQNKNLSTIEELLLPVVEDILNEKRRQWKSHSSITITLTVDPIYRLATAKINRTELTRVLSNLIDNGFQALDGKGHIRLRLSQSEEGTVISIQDTGYGMSEADLALLGTRGASFGKSGGSGLGVFHALETMRSFGGSIRFESKLACGTTAHLTFPSVRDPSTILRKIELMRGQQIVIVDDESLIHQAWRLKLQGTDIVMRSIYSPEQFDAEIDERLKNEAFFIFDFEFDGCERNGIDLISAYNLQKDSVLISGNSDSPEVRLMADLIGVPVFPKHRLNDLPILVENDFEHCQPEILQTANL